MVELRKIFNGKSYLIITNKRVIKNNTVGRVDENILVFSVSDDDDISSFVIIISESLICFICRVIKKIKLDKRTLIICRIKEVVL